MFPFVSLCLFIPKTAFFPFKKQGAPAFSTRSLPASVFSNIDKFPELPHNADPVRVMSGELRHRVTGKTVALDEHRPLFRNSHVPRHEAHLRHLLGRLQAHIAGFLEIRNLESDDRRMGHGMLGVGVTLLVRANGQQRSAFQIDSRRHAALIHIVHHLAVANAQKGVNDALLFVAQQRSDADGAGDRPDPNREETEEVEAADFLGGEGEWLE